MIHRVLVTDKLSDEGLRILQDADGVEVEVALGLSPDELRERVASIDGWVIRSGTQVTAELLDAALELKVVGRAGIGLDNVNVAAATRRGVVVMNTPTGNATTTAEHAVALLMAAARRIPGAQASLRAGEWKRSQFVGTELAGKTLGVIGLGNIGRIVCGLAQGLRMRVIGHDPFATPELGERLGIGLVDFDELLEEADAITLHVPLTDATRGLIGAAELNRARPGVIVVNCARGGIVDEHALAAAVQSGKVSAAAVDVFVQEPPPADHPLLALERVVTTPHLGASTGEAQVAVAVAVAEQVRDFLTTGAVRHAVNLPSVGSEALGRLRPYLHLARQMGGLVAQLLDGRMERLRICIEGDLADDAQPDPIAHAAVAGLLSGFADDVNAVNALVVAQERGLDVSVTTRRKAADFASVIRLEADSGGREARTLAVSGANFGDDDPRIVRIDNFLLEVVPEGELLVHRNNDRPGVIGAVGTLLGAREINVSRLQVGLDRDAGEAMAVWNVDAPLPDEVLDAVRLVQGMTHVRRVRLD